MASLRNFSTIVAFVFQALLFLYDQHNTVKAQGDLSGTPRALFHGSCSDDQASCNNHCKSVEGAIEGFCHDRKCLCINKFQKRNLGGKPASKLQRSCLDGEACQPQNVWERPSARYHGPCFDGFNDNACNDLCVGGEGATAGGSCSNFKSSCYDDC